MNTPTYNIQCTHEVEQRIATVMAELGIIDRRELTKQALGYVQYRFQSIDSNFRNEPSIDRQIQENTADEQVAPNATLFTVMLSPRQQGALEMIANYTRVAAVDALATSIGAFCCDYLLWKQVGGGTLHGSSLEPKINSFFARRDS